ncbi:hypothetical protein KAFR_0E01950 [Kazachstania africana CBS 2517]|uniref:Peptidyl-prolyl cis-trans isomerase n=1 Tax=Kazachstania africana (strain ATCC 22294 / BCRC 22015 / CBS 2517 / CECT 1963 / NBRC 1671 / NRRL Y-8276) TaxID=1071382 RepID=H2AVE9_KAZAF|nr:hypothetical protein KAFR_0E01950 [Kazachstania africana CBS 2517]CCF58349.1 hypothetical protein KAFR_0E01950 [Kazachstania africana CBS 2517]
MNEEETGLPVPWQVKYSKSKKREYFFQPETKSSQWEEPEGTDHEKLKSYLKEHPMRVRCLHLLIKHRDSRRAASHREPKITISKEDAIKELKDLHDKLKDIETTHKDIKTEFGKMAHERSDCSSFKRNGDLGWFGRGEMQPSFEKAAFNLKVNEMSDIVETDSGVHIILRIS